MRVLVCGGRDYADRQRVFETLNTVHDETPITALIEGCARGADRLAGYHGFPDAIGWTWFHSVPVEHYPADWGANGKAAGPIRNKQMLVEGRPDLVIAFPGGRGTANMIEQAERAGVPVRRVT